MPDASDHRTLPPLTGATVDDPAGQTEGEVQLVESAEDLELLDDDEEAGVGPV